MASAAKIADFVYSPDDPLATEHTDVLSWVRDAVREAGDHGYYHPVVELKTLPSGQKLLDGSPVQSRRYVLAATSQLEHWDRQAAAIRNRAETGSQRLNCHLLPGWNEVWGRRQHTLTVANSLLRRALPFELPDLAAILGWCNLCEPLGPYWAPIGYITRALERYAANHELDDELAAAMKTFASRLRSTDEKTSLRCAAAVDQLCARRDGVEVEEDSARELLPSPKPTPAGDAAILSELKRVLGLAPVDEPPATTPIGPDRFPLREGSPLEREHQWLTEFFEVIVGTSHYYQPDLEKFPSGQFLLRLNPDDMGRALLAAAERHTHSLLSRSPDLDERPTWQAYYAAAGLIGVLEQQAFELPRDECFDLLLYSGITSSHAHTRLDTATPKLIAMAEREAARVPLGEGERYVLAIVRAGLVNSACLGSPPEDVSRLTRLIGDGVQYYLAPGEVWADAVNDELRPMPRERREAWLAVLRHALTATAARPSARWLKTAEKLATAVGGDDVKASLLRWLPLVAQGQSGTRLGAYSGDARGAANVMKDDNATCLRGLLWLVQLLPGDEQLTRAVTTVALSAYKKVPGVGPRAVKVGNAAVYALSELGSTDAVGQLAMLKVRVKFGTAQKEIEKAFNAAAEALGLPRDQIEEMGVPSYGLEEGGVRREAFGDYRAELTVNGSDAELAWFDAQGKRLKSVPAKVRSEHKEDLKEIQQAVKDIDGMLPAQRDRIDGMFLLEKSWQIDVWRERYLGHPLIGPIARRLLWCVDGTAALFVDGVPADRAGAEIQHGKTAEITLWHPVGREVDEVVGWRRRLEELGVTQPFKQAHREVYLLTDAERNTRVYSNRFAAHIIRQHQFNALCGARGWRNRLRLMVDDSFPPASRELLNWGLRAEFWIEGVGDNYGVDTNETGTFLRLATDQVRFYRTGAAENWAHAGGGGYALGGRRDARPEGHNDPLPLDEIPALVFSEIMRDVDLFVGVASVGNDPTWQDGGPDNRYRDYWQSYAFGELSGTATTRKEVLERLIPRLKIADRCTLADRFLVVRGTKRTYKIHLGSGNILMEPNDQYLCIVPDARARSANGDVYLPFEGDATLSIIISKALLLAEDIKIKNPTITRQIGGQ